MARLFWSDTLGWVTVPSHADPERDRPWFIGSTGNGAATHASPTLGSAVRAYCGARIWTKRSSARRSPTCRRCYTAVAKLEGTDDQR